MDSWNEMENLVDAVFGSVSSTITSAVSVSNTVCIQMPKRALMFYLTLQKELVLLPFRLSSKAFDALVKNPLMLLFRVYRTATEEGPTPVELLTGEKEPSTQKMHRDFVELRKASMLAYYSRMRKETRARWQVEQYRDRLERLEAETDKKTQEMLKVGLEEKELLKAVASALRYLKSLKLKRDKMSGCFTENLKTLLDEGGNIAGEKLLEIQTKLISVDTAIKEKKDACLNLLKQSDVMEPVVSELSSKTADLNLNHPANGGVSQEAVLKILDSLSGDNSLLNEKVSKSQETLEMILLISTFINLRLSVLSEKLSKIGTDLGGDFRLLERSLEEERTLVMQAEAERDLMRGKLETMASLIKEEEMYLGDPLETCCDDSDYYSVSGSSEDHLMADQVTTVE